MISQKAKLHNRFDFEIYDTETGQTEYAQAENIVLNNMWSRLCSSNPYFSHIGVGTGTGTLSPTRTTLFSHLALKTAVSVETVYDTDTTAHVTKSVTFTESEANGTWTEVGILHGSTAGSNYVTHALITDSEGNPITVNKTNTKIVTVYATVFAEVLANAGGPLKKGSANQLLGHLVNVYINTTFDGFFWASNTKTVDGLPSRLGWLGSVMASFGADVANKRWYTNLARFGTTAANGDIRVVGLGNLIGCCTMPVAGVFEKHDFVGAVVASGDGTANEFDLPKDLIKPASETVYVNGVAKTRGVDYEVHYGLRSSATTLMNTAPGSIKPETIVLPQPEGAYFDDGAATITSIAFKNGGGAYNVSYSVELSVDGINWVLAGSGNLPSYTTSVTLSGFTAAKYKYLRWGGTVPSLAYFTIYCTPPTRKQIKFFTAPANGAAITADFSTEYIPKSANFVLDLQAEILFGEGA